MKSKTIVIFWPFVRSLRVGIRSLVLLTLAFCIVRGQTLDESPFIFAKDNYCEGNQANLTSVMNVVPPKSFAIVIAHRGNREKTDLFATRRLAEVRRTLKYSFDLSRLILAIGEKTDGRPRVEVFVEGKRKLVFETPNNINLKVGSCDQ